MDDILAFLNHKVPATRTMTIAWLEKTLLHPLKGGFGIKKEQIKPIGLQLVKSLDDPEVSVRSSAASVFASLMQICGEKVMSPYFEMLDAVRKAKVKEANSSEQAGGAPLSASQSAPQIHVTPTLLLSAPQQSAPIKQAASFTSTPSPAPAAAAPATSTAKPSASAPPSASAASKAAPSQSTASAKESRSAAPSSTPTHTGPTASTSASSFATPDKFGVFTSSAPPISSTPKRPTHAPASAAVHPPSTSFSAASSSLSAPAPAPALEKYEEEVVPPMDTELVDALLMEVGMNGEERKGERREEGRKCEY